jgi:hypothetical protein
VQRDLAAALERAIDGVPPSGRRVDRCAAMQVRHDEQRDGRVDTDAANELE